MPSRNRKSPHTPSKTASLRSLPAQSPPLHLSEVADLTARESFLLEELRWYFQDSKAAQSGLRSSQGNFEAQMKAPASRSGRETSFDGRTAPHIRRATHIEQSLRLVETNSKFRLREYFRERKEHKPFGQYAGLIPSSRPIWRAYRSWGLPGGMDDFLLWLATELAKPKPHLASRRLMEKAVEESRVRFHAALTDFRGAWTRRPVRQKAKVRPLPEKVSGTG